MICLKTFGKLNFGMILSLRISEFKLVATQRIHFFDSFSTSFFAPETTLKLSMKVFSNNLDL